MAFMFMLIGASLRVLTIISFLMPKVRMMEDRLPDYVAPGLISAD